MQSKFIEGIPSALKYEQGGLQMDDEYQVTTLSIYLCLHHVTYLPTIYDVIDLISCIAQACMRS